MKAISLRQPWADLIVNGFKNIENRTWKTNYRGRILIHASKTFDKDGWIWARLYFPTIHLLSEDQYKRGYVVGSVEITNIITDSSSPWFTGPYGFVLIKPEKFEKPFTYSGKLGIFDIEIINGLS